MRYTACIMSRQTGLRLGCEYGVAGWCDEYRGIDSMLGDADVRKDTVHVATAVQGAQNPRGRCSSQNLSMEGH